MGPGRLIIQLSAWYFQGDSCALRTFLARAAKSRTTGLRHARTSVRAALRLRLWSLLCPPAQPLQDGASIPALQAVPKGVPQRGQAPWPPGTQRALPRGVCVRQRWRQRWRHRERLRLRGCDDGDRGGDIRRCRYARHCLRGAGVLALLRQDAGL